VVKVDCSVQRVQTFEKHIGYYQKYAAVTHKILNKRSFRSFVKWMLTKENIQRQKITRVEVMMFPTRNERGNWLVGTISRRGEIHLYPKRKESCLRLMEEFERDKVFFYIKARAMAALIHEVLHLKYADDENTVRQKTEKYLHTFVRHKYAQDKEKYCILNRLFNAEAVTY
jgi:hypothetical protein